MPNSYNKGLKKIIEKHRNGKIDFEEMLWEILKLTAEEYCDKRYCGISLHGMAWLAKKLVREKWEEVLGSPIEVDMKIRSYTDDGQDVIEVTTIEDRWVSPIRRENQKLDKLQRKMRLRGA